MIRQRRKRKTYSKGFYYKMLRILLVTLLIPILTMLVLYSQTEKLVKEQILISSQNTLEQFFQTVDVVVEEQYNLALNLAFNEKVLDYATYSAYQEPQSPYRRIKLNEELKKLPVSQYSDVFVYYPHDDRVISAFNGSVSPVYYFNANYDKGNASQWEQFQNILNCTSKTPKIYVLERDNEEIHLVLAMRSKYYRDPKREFVVVVMMPAEYLTNALNQSNFTRNSEIMMFDAEEKLLFTNASQDRSQIENVDLSGEMTEIWFGSEKYMMRTIQSEIMECYYGVATPYSYFWEQLFEAKVVFWGGILFSCIMGIMASWYLSKRAYKPVGEMVTRFQEKSDELYRIGEQSEFEFVEKLFQEENQKNETLKKQIRRDKNIVLERFCIALLNGQAEELKENDIFIKNGMRLYSDRFFVALLEVEHSEYDSMLFFILNNVFCELFDAEHKGYVVQLSEKRFAILVNLRCECKEDDLIDLLRQGKQFLAEKSLADISIGAGNICEGMAMIAESHDMAREALAYKYLYGKEALIVYSDVSNRKCNYPVSAESRLYLLVNSFIEGRVQHTPHQFVEKLAEMYEIDEQASMEMIACFHAELRSVLNVLIGESFYAMSERQAIVNGVFEKNTLTEFWKALEDLLMMLQCRERDKEAIHIICIQAKECIDNNYGDPELSVSALGVRLNTPSRLISKLFKESYGISALDYISKTRVQNAKQLLSSTDKSVAEVAADCGFLSDTVFIKTFRKWEGITPKVYRTLVKTENEHF